VEALVFAIFAAVAAGTLGALGAVAQARRTKAAAPVIVGAHFALPFV
jgi:hypothetical protein